LVAAAAATGAAPASAEVLHAKDVLPPGQSGYVSIPGVLEGTGSPHLTDQIPLFANFEYKDHTYNQPGERSSPRPGVEIVRDAYGVPAITGTSDYDAWWGVGYAVAQDRLFELELFRRATAGRLAEILGSGYLDDDLIARRDYYTDAEIDAMLAEIPAELSSRAGAYRDGINAYIQHVTGPGIGELPGEFVALGALPIDPWTLRDTARVGVFLARTVPSGDGNELANALALGDAGARGFDLLHPIRTKGRRVTVPQAAGAFPAQPGRTRRDERIGFRRTRDFLAETDLSGVADTATQVPTRAPRPGADLRRLLPAGGSFMWAISDPRRDRAYLYNGPQLGFQIPELFVEFELHSPAQPNLRGVSAPGIPLIGIGHNDHVAWGFTSGLSDEDDLYVERLTGPETYEFKGEQRQMECRDETFTWNTPVTDLPGLISEPSIPSGSTTERICRTVHGPVQATGEGVALARRYAIWGRELESIVGIGQLNDARTIAEVDRALREVTWNENVIAADDHGEIGFWHPGLHPLRPRRWDERLPYPGDGRAEWRGMLPRSRTPHVINPEQGWLANWNNPPSVGWTNGDGVARERLTGPLHRVRLLQRLVAKVARRPSFERSTAIVRTSGTTAQQFPFLDRRLVRRAAALSDRPGRDALRALLAWDGDYTATDAAGTVAPGVAIWEELKDRLEAILLGPYGEGGETLAGSTGSSHQFDISNGESIAVRTLGARAYARAATATAKALDARFANADPATWREPRRMYEVGAQGAASSPDLPFFDRGTWEQAVALGRR
jgi:acyl-homoserine lactone acylase PvdQ